MSTFYIIAFNTGTLFDHNSCSMFKLSTACSILNEICCNSIIKLDRNHAMKEIHIRNTSKTQQFALIEKKLFGP